MNGECLGASLVAENGRLLFRLQRRSPNYFGVWLVVAAILAGTRSVAVRSQRRLPNYFGVWLVDAAMNAAMGIFCVAASVDAALYHYNR